MKSTKSKSKTKTAPTFIVRSTNAGVFMGQIKSKDLKNGVVEMKNARRLWYWAGAASLSQLALDGVSKPDDCKFPQALPSITVLGVIEIIPCTPAAVRSVNAVPVWKA